MSAPLASLFHGDINIETGSDQTLYGPGNLNVANNALVSGTSNSTTPGTGALTVIGGLGVGADTHLGALLNVSSTSNLQTTFIDTSLGGFYVSGGNAVTVSVGGAVSLTSTGGNSSIISNNSSIISGGLNSGNAVQIIASNAAGGVNVLSGQTGQLSLTAGSGGIQGLTSSGNINLTANNASGNFIVNSSAGNQNLTLSVLGATDSQLLLQSSGINTTLPAISINSSNNAGNIQITNNGGLGSGAITQLAGSGGYSVTTNTGGPVQITAQAAASFFVVNSTASNQNLTIGLHGTSNSSLILESAGTSSTQAILIRNTNTSGSILISQPANSSGKVEIDTGSSGLTAITQTGGGINLTSNGGISSFTNQTTMDNQNLTISVAGGTNSKLILSGSGTNNQAVQILATSTSGGIYASAAGSVQINSSDNTNGISIGTLSNVPIKIGGSTSTTTVYGNLDVRGVTTTVESTVVQITDNLLELNVGPTGSADAGVALKRYQSANNVGTGDVVADTPENSPGQLAQGGTTTSITLISTDSKPDNYYNGYWVKIISGTGANQIRRIKSYNATTKVATIYSTADQTGVLGNPIPVEGLDFATTPTTTSLYGLYPCEWIIAMWDSVANEYAIVCSPMMSGSATPVIAHYVNLHVNNITANAITATSINGATADVSSTFTLTDNNTTPVSLTGLPYNYGVYILLVRPTTAVGTRPFAIFVIGRSNNTSTGSVSRLTSVKGTSNDQIDAQWNASSFPQIFYRPAPGTNTTTNYTYKVISV